MTSSTNYTVIYHQSQYKFQIAARIFKYVFVANLLLSLSEKELRNSVNIWGWYGQEFSVLSFFWLTVYNAELSKTRQWFTGSCDRKEKPVQSGDLYQGVHYYTKKTAIKHTNKWPEYFDIRSHRRHARIVQCYSAGSANVQLYLIGPTHGLLSPHEYVPTKNQQTAMLSNFNEVSNFLYIERRLRRYADVLISGVVGRGRRETAYPHFFGLKFVQKLVHCCNWLLTSRLWVYVYVGLNCLKISV